MGTQQELPPTERQIDFLRALAARNGVSFEQPASRAHASAQIDSLLYIRRPRLKETGHGLEWQDANPTRRQTRQFDQIRRTHSPTL